MSCGLLGIKDGAEPETFLSHFQISESFEESKGRILSLSKHW